MSCTGINFVAYIDWTGRYSESGYRTENIELAAHQRHNIHILFTAEMMKIHMLYLMNMIITACRKK